MKANIYIALLVVLPACIWARRPLPDATIEAVLGGPENIQIVEAAKDIEIYRVFDDESGNVPKPATARICGYPCLPQARRFSWVEAERVIASLLSVETYREKFVCDFIPAVLFRFASGESTLDFVVCFNCGELIIYRDGVVVHRAIRFAEGVTIGFSGSCAREFKALAKRAFPKDDAIQALGSKKQ